VYPIKSMDAHARGIFIVDPMKPFCGNSPFLDATGDGNDE
jgi:hypothetical protein